MVAKVKSLLEDVNDLVGHLKLKTEPQLDKTASGAPQSLSDLGITLDSDNVSLSLSDESALTSALDDDFQDVADLLDYILDNADSRLADYVDGTGAIIPTTKEGIDDQIELLDNRIDRFEARLSTREDALRKQLYEFQSQFFTMQYQFQSTQAAMAGMAGLLNRLA
ncbi:MAG: flagellar filament capping protein FliD [Anaerolineae bacterium]